MSERLCQSCAMPMEKEENLGTNADGSKNTDFCTYCYQNGSFTAPETTMEQMIEICVPYMAESGMDGEVARKYLNEVFPKLKRWQ